MTNRPPDAPRKVALEDLLRLKKAERPAPAFWIEFERELRRKQLAALVERQAWWHGFAAAFGGFGRLQLPLGAAAALALTFVSIRYYQTDTASSPSLIDRPASVSKVEVRGRHENVAAAALSAVPAVEKTATEQQPMRGAGDAAMTAKASGAASSQDTGLIPWIGGVGADDHAGTLELTPSARSIAANLATAATIESELVKAGVRIPGFEERALPARHSRYTVEILPTAAAVAEARRTRLPIAVLLEGAYAPEPTVPEHARSRTIRYLTEDGLDRKISRLVSQGDRLSIKL